MHAVRSRVYNLQSASRTLAELRDELVALQAEAEQFAGASLKCGAAVSPELRRYVENCDLINGWRLDLGEIANDYLAGDVREVLQRIEWHGEKATVDVLASPPLQPPRPHML